MKNLLHKLLILSFVAVFVACSEDEEPAPHTVGVWELEGASYENLPADYSYSEGLYYISSSLGVKSWVLELEKNKSFLQKISYTDGSASNNSEGTWSVEEDILTMEFEDEDEPLEWKVEKDKTDQLWISRESSDFLMSDAIQNELVEANGSVDGANAYLNSLFDKLEENPNDQETIDELNRIFTAVTFDMVFKFIRSE